MAPFDLQLPFPITMTPPMFSSTPLSCVSLTSLSSAPRALTLTKLHHLRNMRYVSGLIIVRRVSSLLATANIILSLLGLLIISTLTFTCLRSECSLQLTSVTMKMLLLRHANTNVTLLPRLFSESYPPVPSCLATVSPIFRLPVLHLRLYHVLPSLHLPPSSLPDPLNYQQLLHNLPMRRSLRHLVHNTPLLPALAPTPNDHASLAKAALPQVPSLATCPILPTTLDLLDPQFLLLSAPVVVRIIKAKVLIKVPLRAKINSPPTGHLSILLLLKAFPKIFPGSPPNPPPRILIKASLTVKVLLLLPYSHLPPTPHILAVHKICISHLLSNIACCQPGHTVRFAVWLLFVLRP